MLRALVGFILGFISGMMVMVSIITPSAQIKTMALIFSVMMLLLSVTFAHLRHKHKRNEYYNRFKGGKVWRT
jgi:biotin transporter BioY